MKVAKVTRAEADEISALVDRAYGYPRAGTLGPSLVQVEIQRTWDGTGAAPFGWTATQCARWELADARADVWVHFDDATLARSVASADLSASEKARLAALSRVDEADTGERQPRASRAP